MDDGTSKTSGVSGWGPGGGGCGQGGSAQPGEQWAGVQAVQWSEPQGSLGLVREESPACSWGWGWAQRVPSWGGTRAGVGGVAHLSPQCSPLLWTPGPRAPPEPTVLILPAPGKACFFLLMGCRHQRRGAQATSEVWGLSTGRTAVPPQGTEPAGRPERKVRRSQAGRAAASHAGSPSPCEPVWSLRDPEVPSESPLPHPWQPHSGSSGWATASGVSFPAMVSALLGPSLLFHKLKKFLQAQLTPPSRSFPFFLFFINRGERGERFVSKISGWGLSESVRT